MSKIKNFKSYIKQQITLDEYFTKYYNFPKGTFSSFLHKDIKKLLPFVKRKGNSEVTNENILKGEVILVKDYEGIVQAYLNPFLYNEYDDLILSCKENSKVQIIFAIDDDIDIQDQIDLENLSNYELQKLLKDSKEQKEYKLARQVKKELFFRPENHGDEKRRKLLKQEKRMIKNDKY